MVYSRGMPPEMREARRRRSLLQTEGTGWDDTIADPESSDPSQWSWWSRSSRWGR
jgi:hypothetical protein